MKSFFKLVFFGGITFLLVFVLSKSIQIGSNSIPALGPFLSLSEGIWNNIEESDLAQTTEVLKGPYSDITIYYDENLIPHIYAESDTDLYFGQGYVTAKFRLWQMEFQTHAAAGRLSEIVGKKALDFDRTARRRGMVFASENSIAEMENDPELKKVITSYSNGVNAFINSLDQKEYPLEYKLLNYHPEPWNVQKTALLLKYMALDLSASEKDLENTNFAHLFGKDVLDLLYPDNELPIDPIVENIGNWKKPTVSKKYTEEYLIEPVSVKRITPVNPDNGSNNWAINKEKSANGNPILASDPHLKLSLPSLWFVMHLNSPNVNVAGATLPGSPCVIIGFNENVAWGVTNAQRDLIDWYKIKFKEDSKDQYFLDGEWKNTSKRIENIKIKNGKTFIDTVYYTRFGPVMYESSFRSKNEKSNYAFKWIAHQKSKELKTFIGLNKAKTYEDYMNALDHYTAPAQNFAFASVDGTIAMRIQGKFPLKNFEEGKFLRDGTDSRNDWTEFIPFRENVMYKNPDRSFVSSANQYPVDTTYPYYITARKYQNYRNRRINNVLRSKSKFTLQEMMDLQNDNFNMIASESLPFFLSVLNKKLLSEQENEVIKELEKWDFYNTKDSKSAAYFEAWFDVLKPLIWDEIDAKKEQLYYPENYTTIELIKKDSANLFFDRLETKNRIENSHDIVSMAFSEAVNKIENWKKEYGTLNWRNYKSTFIEHLTRLESFSRKNIAIGGNHDIVNATSEEHGPSWRMLVELEKGNVTGYGIYPGGQSGNLGSKHYDDLLLKWAEGEYIPVELLKLNQIQNK